MTVLCHSAVIYFMKKSQIITSRKVTDAQNGSHAGTARSFRLRVGEWKQLKKILMKAHTRDRFSTHTDKTDQSMKQSLFRAVG